MLSTEIEKRLEECLVGKDTLTRVKNLLDLHGEVFKQIIAEGDKIKSLLEKDKNRLNLIKKANYQWLYAEKELKAKYSDENILDDMFRQLTISISSPKDQRLLRVLGWLDVKKSDHPVFKTLRELVERF